MDGEQYCLARALDMVHLYCSGSDVVVSHKAMGCCATDKAVICLFPYTGVSISVAGTVPVDSVSAPVMPFVSTRTGLDLFV